MMAKHFTFTFTTAALGGAFAVLLASPAMAQVTTTTTKAVVTTTMSAPAVLPMEKPDPEMQGILNALKSLKPRPIETLSVDAARKQPTMTDAVMKVARARNIKAPDNSMVERDSMSFQTKDGNEVKGEVYYVKMEGAAAKNRPVILYFHGGGWVLATNKVYEGSIMALAKKTGAIVVSPEYNKSPEVLFPEQHIEAFTAYNWVLENAAKYGGDPSRIAVVGESAGGNLAANVGIMARDNNVRPPVALGLIYPVAGSDMTTPSYVQNANAKPLNKPMMNWFMTKISKPETKDSVAADARIDLSKANVTGLPRTTVITAGIDPLRSEGENLANQLRAAGVPVVYQNYSGVTHEFFGADLVLAKARDAQNLLVKELNAAFNQQ